MAISKKQQRINTENSVPELLDEYAKIQSKIQDDLDRMYEIEEQLRELDPGTYEGFGSDEVKVSSYTRLNTSKAMSMLSARSQARVMVLRPDARLIRKYFPGVARRSTDTFNNRIQIDVSKRHLTIVE